MEVSSKTFSIYKNFALYFSHLQNKFSLGHIRIRMHYQTYARVQLSLPACGVNLFLFGDQALQKLAFQYQEFESCMQQELNNSRDMHRFQIGTY